MRAPLEAAVPVSAETIRHKRHKGHKRIGSHGLPLNPREGRVPPVRRSTEPNPQGEFGMPGTSTATIGFNQLDGPATQSRGSNTAARRRRARPDYRYPPPVWRGCEVDEVLADNTGAAAMPRRGCRL